MGSRSSANLALNSTIRRENGQKKKGPEAVSTSQSSNSLRTISELNQNQEAKERPIVISSIDTFTHLSGFTNKLKGYQKFLQSYPSYRNKVVLIQFIPSIYCHSKIEQVDKSESAQNNRDDYFTESIGTLKELRNQIIKTSQEIHQEFGTHCLILQEGNPPLAKRLAVWSQS